MRLGKVKMQALREQQVFSFKSAFRGSLELPSPACGDSDAISEDWVAPFKIAAIGADAEF